jgi:membrane protein YdbS with pleckstrin-like domain
VITNDIINGLFELVGSVLCWANVIKLRKDKKVKGVYWSVQCFFASWGLWNLWYYSSLNHWASFYAGIVLCLGNIVWVFLAIKYKACKPDGV